MKTSEKKTGCVSEAYDLHLSILVLQSPEKRVKFHGSVGKKFCPGFPGCPPTCSGRDDAEASSARPLQGDTFWLSPTSQKWPQPPGRVPEGHGGSRGRWSCLASTNRDPPLPRRACPRPRLGEALAEQPLSEGVNSALHQPRGEGPACGWEGSHWLGGLAEFNFLKSF